jgi:hypothetical protein
MVMAGETMEGSVTMVPAALVLAVRRARGSVVLGRLALSFLMLFAVNAATPAKFRSVRMAKSPCIAGLVSAVPQKPRWAGKVL